MGRFWRQFIVQLRDIYTFVPSRNCASGGLERRSTSKAEDHTVSLTCLSCRVLHALSHGQVALPVGKLHTRREGDHGCDRLENNVGRVRLSPTGIDFDERVLPLGKGTSLRAAASVLFPRQIPVPEDQPLLDCRIHRLGLKSVW